MRLLTCIALLLICSVSWSGESPGPPISCFEKKDLLKVLELVPDKDHFLRYETNRKLDNEVGKRGCSWFSVPAGSSYTVVEFFETDQEEGRGFVFPIAQVVYSNGLIMYSALGIYPRKDWQLVRHTGKWRTREFIEPKSCDPVYERVDFPWYVRVAENCMTRRIFN
ncbi:hypothetical protein H6781_02345 [Candidatus Nomurabacteria bacterium]|nr:hypothetical protein [Candidatus Nomurabacteria bacterium]MCB9818004.1 hypothetical protein [Candidatus Nomurabacteria bacterium]